MLPEQGPAGYDGTLAERDGRGLQARLRSSLAWLRGQAAAVPERVEALRSLPDQQLAARYRRAVRRLPQRDGPAPVAVGELVDGALAEVELDARARARAERARERPPAYLAAALGPFPAGRYDPAAGSAWLSAAAAAERYRLLVGVSDPERPLGDPSLPAEAWQRAERARCQAHLTQARELLLRLAAREERLRRLLGPHQLAGLRRFGKHAAVAFTVASQELDRFLTRARQAWPEPFRGWRVIADELGRAWLEALLGHRTAHADPAAPGAAAEVLTSAERARVARVLTIVAGTPAIQVATAPQRRYVRAAPAAWLHAEVARLEGLLDALGAESKRTGRPLGRLLRTAGQRPALGLLAAAELAWREARALDGRCAHPPPYLAAALGQPPAGPRAMGYRAVALAIEAFRREHQVTDPGHPLGPRPVASQRAAAWDAVAQRIAGYLGSDGSDPAGVAGAVRLDPRTDLAALLPPERLAACSALLGRLQGTTGGPPPAAGEVALLRLARAPSVVLHAEVARAHRLPAGPGDPGSRWELERGAVAARELLRRDREALTLLRASPPGELVATLGWPPPAGSPASARWVQDAREFCTRRLAARADRPTCALGAPVEGAGAAQPATIRREVGALSDEGMDRAAEQGTGLDPAQEIPF